MGHHLNEQAVTLHVRHRVTVEYVRHSELETEMKPLRVLSAQGMVAVDEQARYYGKIDPNAEEHGPGCSVGQLAGERTFKDRSGDSYIAHWIVKPGREENRTLVTNWMRVPYDTSVHYIAVHLHPFADSLELRDLTTGDTVFKSKATKSIGRIGLDHVEFFSSEEGVRLYKGHEYALISVYNNTSGEQQDAMAVMFVYMVDNNFEKKLLAAN